MKLFQAVHKLSTAFHIEVFLLRRCLCVMCFLQVHEKALSDLSVVPENEPLDSDTEAEKNLVERIKSIKKEK